ncbi:hypothetical protein NCCP2495_16090 [Dietzia sp. NCCP-2495]|uniref:hypothetical protein n=1 Tax=Dietzia sp. NCCP-2495 TaxID=2934675 RepID=UPI0022317C95|nr:hypothetical protein [Dietzia sp. NCCP-2495]GLB63730.1 hypothetical protein NCCP2495_16090 [Dietzia sp. NCCP-2495]
MPITLTVDDQTAGILVEKLANDRYFLAEAPADHAAMILFYEADTIEMLFAAYGPERDDPRARLHTSAFRILEGVVNNTWLDNREDKLSEPLAAIIQCDLKTKTATVTYHLGDESEAWRFNDANSKELRAELAP